MRIPVHVTSSGRGLFRTIGLICALIAAGAAQAQGDVQASVSEVVLHSFTGPVHGAYPFAGLVRDATGSLYGTTIQGGTGNGGVVYKIDARGRQRVLYSFSGGLDGLYPVSGVALDSAGNLYGITERGGSSGLGVLYKVDTSGNETVLHNFTGGSDGYYPGGGLVLDSAGNLYGTASGGSAGLGVIYKLDPTGNVTVLHTFAGADGSDPAGGLVFDSAGNLYGTAAEGGSSGVGVVYKLDPSGNEIVLHNFTGGVDGGYPFAGVVVDSAGNLYGTTYYGGSSGAGVVYKLDPSDNEMVLHAFAGGSDGSNPRTGVILDSAGNLYGTTDYGGSSGYGTVYKLNPAGNETLLHTFTAGADGAYPSGVIVDPSGNLFGTTNAGGLGGEGLVFELDAGGNETLLYTFPTSAGGSGPHGGVVLDSAGNLYGTTSAGYGGVFRLSPLGSETILYTFTGGADGGSPPAGVTLDSAGNLYGATYGGGASGYGVVFRLDPVGNQTVLHSFTGGSDGSHPEAGVVVDSAGNLYGTTANGGLSGRGVVYKLDLGGNETVVHNFTGGSDGGNPYAGVVLDSTGNIYGTTTNGGSSGRGVVYKLDLGGNETVVHNFTGGSDGGNPYAGVVLDSAGNIYGTTYDGGSAGAGVVYRLDPAGNETVLHNFTGGSDGGSTEAGVVLDKAGNTYGATYSGGSAGAGVVYRLDPSGNETVLHDFTGGSDGSNPYASVTLDSAGSLYGTTLNGGKGSGGVVYKIRGAVPRR